MAVSREIEQFVEENDGVVGVAELAGFLDAEEGEVRAFARRNSLRRIGSSFVFNTEEAQALAETLWDDDEGPESEDELESDEFDDDDDDDE